MVSTAGMFVDCTAMLSDLDSDKMTPEMLDRIAEHLLKQALGDNPVVVAGAKRRLEAGESVNVRGFTEPGETSARSLPSGGMED